LDLGWQLGATSVTWSSTARRIAVGEAFINPAPKASWQRMLQSSSVYEGFKGMIAPIFADTETTRGWHERLADIGSGRIAHMDATGISVQILSLTLPGIQNITPDKASELANLANDRLFEATKVYPGRLFGFTAIVPQATQHSTREIRRGAERLGMRGVVINSQGNSRYLDDPVFSKIFEAAEALRQPIYLPSREPSSRMMESIPDYGLDSTMQEFAAGASLHALRLILSGTFDRFPRLTVILSHLGEALPFSLQRIDNRYHLLVKAGVLKPLKRLPSEYFRENFFITTSGFTSAPPLQLSLDVLGEQQILFATDDPYGSPEEAVAFMNSVQISEQSRRAIYHENAERVFNLPHQPADLEVIGLA
jgi:5-carboxyvanillate decarboxylase